MPITKHQKTKTLTIRPNDRSSDFVTPNFIYGCAGGCRNSYCYVMRYNYDNVFINDNRDQILQGIVQHAANLTWPKPANQVDATYWTYDIGCSTDIALHWKHYAWSEVFDTFKSHPRLKATFATKYVNPQLLTYAPQQKIRLRFSLMPQATSTILEPKTSLISARVAAISEFVAAGYEVHLNFSPIVVYENWLEDYRQLFELIADQVPITCRAQLQAECIFLTHNPWQHERNLAHARATAEQLLWTPAIQEAKTSQYGSQGVRYKAGLKRQFIQQWCDLHAAIIPWNTVRYIF